MALSDYRKPLTAGQTGPLGPSAGISPGFETLRWRAHLANNLVEVGLDQGGGQRTGELPHTLLAPLGQIPLPRAQEGTGQGPPQAVIVEHLESGSYVATPMDANSDCLCLSPHPGQPGGDRRLR
jgi:hypothetical protein